MVYSLAINLIFAISLMAIVFKYRYLKKEYKVLVLSKNYEINKLLDELKVSKEVIKNAPFPVWTRSKDLVITYFNNEYSKLLTFETDQEIDPINLELDSATKLIAKQAQINKTSIEVEKHIVVNGRRLFFHIIELPLSNGEMVGFAFDLTSKEKIKQELEKHMIAHADLLESSSTAMAIYGADMRLTFFNQAFINLWQLDEKWLHTNPSYGDVLEELRKKRKLPEQSNFLGFKRDQLKLFTTLIQPHNDFFHLPDGKYLRILVIPHALGGLLFSYEDMTDRLALETSYNTLTAVQKTTLDNMNEGVAVYGEDGRLKLSNSAYAKLWQLETEFLESQPHFTEVLENMKKLFVFSDWEAFKQDVVHKVSARQHVNETIERADGSVLTRTFTPLPDGATLVANQDITASIIIERNKKRA
jgi:PAS domain-containing protein